MNFAQKNRQQTFHHRPSSRFTVEMINLTPGIPLTVISQNKDGDEISIHAHRNTENQQQSSSLLEGTHNPPVQQITLQPISSPNTPYLNTTPTTKRTWLPQSNAPREEEKVHTDLLLEHRLLLDVVRHMRTMTSSMLEVAKVINNLRHSK